MVEDGGRPKKRAVEEVSRARAGNDSAPCMYSAASPAVQHAACTPSPFTARVGYAEEIMGCARCGIVEITTPSSDGFPTLSRSLSMGLGQWQQHAHGRILARVSGERYCTADALLWRDCLAACQRLLRTVRPWP